MLQPKKNSYKEFDNEKKSLPLKNSPPQPPNKFSNGPSLMPMGMVLSYTAKLYIACARLSDSIVRMY